MSSLRKYLKRKSYRERTQPSSRKRLGLLEKHKDYVERAQKHHEHTAELERLQREAEERNPNEFHFSMEHERTKSGIPVSFQKKCTPQEELALKSKDLTFIQLRIQQETKKVDRLRARLHLLGCPSENRHIVFLDDVSETEKWMEAEFFDTPKECLHRRFNRPRRQELKNSMTSAQFPIGNQGKVEEIQMEQAQQYRELNNKIELLQQLIAAENELRLKKELAKGEEHKKITLPDGTIAVKWKRIRK